MSYLAAVSCVSDFMPCTLFPHIAYLSECKSSPNQEKMKSLNYASTGRQSVTLTGVVPYHSRDTCCLQGLQPLYIRVLCILYAVPCKNTYTPSIISHIPFTFVMNVFLSKTFSNVNTLILFYSLNCQYSYLKFEILEKTDNILILHLRL